MSILFLIIIVLGFGAVLYSRALQRIESHEALVITRAGGAPRVSLTDAWVWPVMQHAEKVDLSVKRLEIEHRGGRGVICKDNLRADVVMYFFVKVGRGSEDILRVAQSIGCARAARPEVLEALFAAKFSEALKTLAKRHDFIELYASQDSVCAELQAILSGQMNGYDLDEVMVVELGQTSIEHLDPNNILDAQGIRKIKKLAAAERVLANEIDQNIQRGAPELSVTGEDRREALLRKNVKVIELPEPVHLDSLLPAAAEQRDFTAEAVSLRGRRLEFMRDGAVEASLALDEPWSAMLSQQQGDVAPMISVELRQRRAGLKLSMIFMARQDEGLEEGGRGEALNLPSLSQRGVTLEGAVFRRLIEHLRFVMQQEGRERWGV